MGVSFNAVTKKHGQAANSPVTKSSINKVVMIAVDDVATTGTQRLTEIEYPQPT